MQSLLPQPQGSPVLVLAPWSLSLTLIPPKPLLLPLAPLALAPPL